MTPETLYTPMRKNYAKYAFKQQHMLGLVGGSVFMIIYLYIIDESLWMTLSFAFWYMYGVFSERAIREKFAKDLNTEMRKQGFRFLGWRYEG